MANSQKHHPWIGDMTEEELDVLRDAVERSSFGFSPVARFSIMQMFMLPYSICIHVNRWQQAFMWLPE